MVDIKNSVKKEESKTLQYARAALMMMVERNIDPTPVNYSVWYHYVAADIKALNGEIETILKTKSLIITDDLNIYLYNKYLSDALNKEAEEKITHTTQNTQTVLEEVMGIIDAFSGDTKNYSAQIDSHVNHLSKKITDPVLKEMAKEIVNRALAIRNSGVELSMKLEESKHEVVQLKENLEKVTNEANRDHLTGVGNRKALERKLDELTSWATQNNTDLCLLMIDIDHFKKFNDKFGHQIGDEVLKRVSAALFDSIKGKDFVARYGGEEFAILLPNTPLAGALIVGENIRKAAENTTLQRKDTGKYIDQVTISIGVARYRPGQDSPAVLISRADSALYRSKMGGRNRVTQESFD